ncbi:MAG TPA: PilZ domain-containing protein [Candidatus Hydrogenedentes bacterium]|nr:PilZ domain-containing protein [Candidatus Hydrogenedentota bacterium]HNT89870.1 PilZ domain-containing protein [Candidatus Hydrogenedentota bacterium]
MDQDRRRTLRRQADREARTRLDAIEQGADPRGELWSKEFRHKRRRAIRHNCSVQISLEISHRAGSDDTWSVAHHAIKGRLLDLSADGASLFTAQPLEIGQVLDLVIGLRNKRELRTRGQVRWTKGIPQHNGYGSGVQFSRISAPDQQAILEYLKELDENVGL